MCRNFKERNRMSIEELEDKHFYISHQHKESHTKLSIEFAISVLEEIINPTNFSQIMNKIQELEQYLNEK